MKLIIEESFNSNQGFSTEENEWATYDIFINNENVFSVKHDNRTVKNNTLFDNFGDCLNIIPLLKKFYDFGKNNIDIEFKLK